jgi:DNA-binding MarR family transcriptional regulator
MNMTLLWKLLESGRAYGEQECRKLSFNPNSSQTRICIYLMSHPGVSQYDIALSYNMKESTVAKTLLRLENEGLIERRINPADRRMRLVYLSEAGKQAYAPIRKIQRNWAGYLSSRLTEQENAEFDRLCQIALLEADKLLD